MVNLVSKAACSARGGLAANVATNCYFAHADRADYLVHTALKTRPWTKYFQNVPETAKLP